MLKCCKISCAISLILDLQKSWWLKWRDANLATETKYMESSQHAIRPKRERARWREKPCMILRIDIKYHFSVHFLLAMDSESWKTA